MLDPSLLQTPRLVLRPPRQDDAEALFRQYASDPVVTKYMSWPTHIIVRDSEAFLSFSKAEWAKWPAGPLLMTSKVDGALLGSTGLAFEAPHCASTGFVLAKAAWGMGYASEALRAVVNIAAALGLQRLYALCHVSHDRSARVLERCGFIREATFRKRTLFPNLGLPEPQDVYCYAREWPRSQAI